MSFLKKKTKIANPANPPAPRTTEDLTKEYFELRARAGETQYQMYVLESELNRLNNRMREVNHEAADRKKLDEATQAALKAKTEVKE